jgi:hypothetical protein
VNSKIQEKIKKACEKLPTCTGLFLTLDSWDEKPLHEKYTITACLILNVDSTKAQIEEAQSKHGAIEGYFDCCDGIEIAPSGGGVFVENAITLFDYRNLSKWHLDYLTLQDKSGQHVDPAPTVS